MTLRAALLALAFLLPLTASAAPDLSSDALLRDHLWRELTAKPRGQRPTVGLVLSAGSLRATAHVGVISVLEEAGFPIDVVAGTSMGAVIGSFYAAGKPVSWLRKMASALKVNSGSNVNAFSLARYLLSDKLFSSEKTQRYMERELADKRIEQLKKPFACVSMDLYSGEAIVFRDGPLAPAVRASMNLPGIFQPVEYRHRYLVDGGVVDYVPIDAARLLGAEWVLASVTETDFTRAKPTNVLASLEQVIDIRGALLSREQMRAANFLVEPPVGDIGMYETARVQEAMTKGVIAAHASLAQAMESYIVFSMGSLVNDYLPDAGAKP